MQHQSRQIQLETRKANTASRTVPAVLSSTYPVDRGGYSEVLLHGRENVDLTREPLPLIESHDGSTLNIGVVEQLHLAGDKLRGIVRFGNSQRASEVWADVQAAIVRNLSIGYAVNDARDKGDVIEVTRWQPVEVSLVSVPADPQAGLNRSYPIGNFAMFEENNGQSAADAGTMSRSQRRAENRAAQVELDRVNDLLKMGAAYDARDLAQDAVADGTSVAEFQRQLLDHINGKSKRNGKREPKLGNQGAGIGAMPQQGRQYSVVKAMRSMIDPNSVDAGYEREVSQEIAHRSGRNPRGMYLPVGELNQRAYSGLSVAGDGDLVGTEHMGGSFIEALRNRSVVMRLGPTILSGLTQDISIPRLASSSTTYWIAGDGSDSLTESGPGFDAVKLSPKTVGALVKMSRKLILQSEPSAEQIVRSDLASVMAAEIDRAALQGSGTSNEPTGVTKTTGVSAGNFAGATPTFAEMVAMEADLTTANVEGAPAYVTTQAMAGTLKSTQVTSAGSEMIWRPGQDGAGIVNGLKAVATGNCPASTVVLGRWSDFLVGMWNGVDIEVNPYEDFASGVVAVRAFASMDFGVRHAASFAVYTPV